MRPPWGQGPRRYGEIRRDSQDLQLSKSVYPAVAPRSMDV